MAAHLQALVPLRLALVHRLRTPPMQIRLVCSVCQEASVGTAFMHNCLPWSKCHPGKMQFIGRPMLLPARKCHILRRKDDFRQADTRKLHMSCRAATLLSRRGVGNHGFASKLLTCLASRQPHLHRVVDLARSNGGSWQEQHDKPVNLMANALAQANLCGRILESANAICSLRYPRC